MKPQSEEQGRFGRGADDWAKRAQGVFFGRIHHSPTLSVPLKHLDAQFDEGKDAVSKFNEMMEFRLWSAFVDELKAPLSCTESPIEELMLLALTVVASNEGEVTFRVGGKDFGLTRVPRGRRTCVTIQPQAEVARHRVDFLVEMAETRTDYSKPGGTITLTKSVVVECDGHDFHEKTRGQAEKDKRRDRELQDAGHGVFRFTGSEITRKAFECAEQAVRFLKHGIRAYQPSTAVTVESLRKELEAFLMAHGGLGDTWFWDRDELMRRREDVWSSVELGVASEGPLFQILNWPYHGSEMLGAYNDFCDLVRSLGWCHEQMTHCKVFFYRDAGPDITAEEARLPV